jgi:hypothetical protein
MFEQDGIDEERGRVSRNHQARDGVGTAGLQGGLDPFPAGKDDKTVPISLKEERRKKDAVSPDAFPESSVRIFLSGREQIGIMPINR